MMLGRPKVTDGERPHRATAKRGRAVIEVR